MRLMLSPTLGQFLREKERGMEGRTGLCTYDMEKMPE